MENEDTQSQRDAWTRRQLWWGEYNEEADQHLDASVQTDPMEITRYWDLPRQVVIDIARQRRVHEANKPKVTKTELGNTLLRQDLGAKCAGATVWV